MRACTPICGLLQGTLATGCTLFWLDSDNHAPHFSGHTGHSYGCHHRNTQKGEAVDNTLCRKVATALLLPSSPSFCYIYIYHAHSSGNARLMHLVDWGLMKQPFMCISLAHTILQQGLRFDTTSLQKRLD